MLKKYNIDIMNISKFLRLASLIAKLNKVETDKGTLTTADEIAEGVEVYIEDENGEFIAAPDGDYETEESIITVKDGKVEKYFTISGDEISLNKTEYSKLLDEAYKKLLDEDKNEKS